MSPARGERIEREASAKIHHGHDGPAIRLQYLAAPAKDLPPNHADGSDDRDASKQEVSRSEGHLCLIYLYAAPTGPLTIGALRARSKRGMLGSVEPL